MALREVLVDVHLQEGENRPAAEQALQDLLALAPAHARAQQNLAALR